MVAESINYQYLAFNGKVYSTNDVYMQAPICSVEDLAKPYLDEIGRLDRKIVDLEAARDYYMEKYYEKGEK